MGNLSRSERSVDPDLSEVKRTRRPAEIHGARIEGEMVSFLAEDQKIRRRSLSISNQNNSWAPDATTSARCRGKSV
jgi:hypothetical protein